jgi:regulator of replication initiation timing
MLVAEKLSLASELASLRAEIQHLKSQVASNQALLSQKLALERDLSSLQQDLETLRRSAQIAQTAQQRTNSENERLENRISILEAELAEQRLQREKNERNAQKASSDWESTKTSLESRLNVSRNKLRVATEQLKTCRFELNDSRNTVGPSDPGSLDADRGRGGMIKPSLKRNSVQQLDADSMIGTPGDMPAAKKIKKGLALPGDKSAFSITPFLNRASGAGLESPHGHIGPNIGFGDKEKSYDHLDQVETDETPVNRIKAKQPVSKITRLPAQVTQVESCETGRKVISNKKGSSTRKSRISLSLENVSEAEENTEDPLLLSKTTHLVTDVPEKRKRKVWAGSLLKPVLDDAENINRKNDKTSNFARLGPIEILQTTASTFGHISPLKKKKRAVPIDSREALP